MIEKSSTFDYQHIAAALDGQKSPDDSTFEEQEVWFAQFAPAMTKPSARKEAFFAVRGQLGCGVDLSDSGELIFEKGRAIERRSLHPSQPYILAGPASAEK